VTLSDKCGGHQMDSRRKPFGAVIAIVGLLLQGCAGPLLLGIPVSFIATEVAPRAVNGKGLVEDGVDMATGKDCRLIEGTVREDRQFCEERGSPETDKDFKGFMGQSDTDDAP
jgi:hypothetical protein